MSRNKLTGALAAVLIVGGIAGALIWGPTSGNQTATNQTPATEQTTPPANITISQDGKTINYDGVAGQTALDTLKALTSVETETSSFGEFVTTINGLKADATKEFWAFYVNDKQASEGAGTYQAKAGDKIEWRLEKLQ